MKKSVKIRMKPHNFENNGSSREEEIRSQVHRLLNHHIFITADSKLPKSCDAKKANLRCYQGHLGKMMTRSLMTERYPKSDNCLQWFQFLFLKHQLETQQMLLPLPPQCQWCL